MNKLVIRDSSGNVINIGDWDYLEEEVLSENGELTTIIHNPLPTGATSSVEEVSVLPDGGLAAAIE